MRVSLGLPVCGQQFQLSVWLMSMNLTLGLVDFSLSHHRTIEVDSIIQPSSDPEGGRTHPFDLQCHRTSNPNNLEKFC